tara:strand:+ start:249 stop:1199 length:951 start_codon:yes stop_codon:yes gene_type:complete
MAILEPISSAENIKFKPKFKERYSQLTDWDEFSKYSLSFLRRSIRVNTLQSSVEEVRKSIEAKGWKLDPIPWCKGGFWIKHPDRKDVGNLLEHHLGKIYVQESVSMIPPLVLQPRPGEIVLDMCAAPGSKTTQIAAMMENKGLIVANDFKGQRLQSLGINIQRSGITNIVVSKMHGKRFHNFQFDKILVDAPCSGTGTIRKSLKTISIWNEGMIRKIAREQIGLAESAVENLKKGGEMVYSTCSLEPEENEVIVHLLLEKFPELEVVPVELLGLKLGKPVMEWKGIKLNSQIKHVLRIWPQDNDTGGFFVVKLRKK